ncbi:hypothetical protein C8034_v003622 [Colletotrichum sidae]|uniref:Nuclear pore protein n=1 Tax=Colletotrichum sidae TaxID=1347389 RepID=A0A4R8TSI1_9PEZI|nr:hypothetical protein C8034_v003622 [Colletotrichum sidae]
MRFATFAIFAGAGATVSAGNEKAPGFCNIGVNAFCTNFQVPACRDGKAATFNAAATSANEAACKGKKNNDSCTQTFTQHQIAMSPLIETASSPDLTELDPRGDIVFTVGPSTDPNKPPRKFRLCSRAMARASPVLDRMLHGNFAESRPPHPAAAAAAAAAATDTNWEVRLPDDDADAFDVLASIAHARFRRVPRVLPPPSIAGLFDLTVLTHYYDATEVLAPWLQGWVSGLGEAAGDGEMQKLLWVAWELGHRQLFESTARRMVVEGKGGGGEGEVDGVNLPLDIIARIRTIRLKTIRSILDVFRDLAERLVLVDEGPRWCKHASYMGPHRCESMILGSVTFCLTRAGIWPIPEAEDFEESVVALYSTLMNLVIHDIGRPGDKGGVDHSECNPRGFLMGRIKDILAGVENPVGEEERRHLDRQVEKLLV